MRTNDIKLSPHFRLYEFADHQDNELVVLDPYTPRQLEILRTRIHESTGIEHEIIVTSGTRTEKTNNALGELLGWTDEGGPVSRDSTHQPKHGGRTVDIKARNKHTKELMPIAQLANFCQGLFIVIISRYLSHVHLEVEDKQISSPTDVEKPEPQK